MAAHDIAQFRKGHLCVQPARILGDLIHRGFSVIADEIDAVTQDHERFKARADRVPGKFKITGMVIVFNQFGAQRTQILSKVLQEIVVTRAHVCQDAAFVLGQRNDRPLVKNDFAIAVVHLVGALLYVAESFVNSHKILCAKETSFAPAKQEICSDNYPEIFIFPRNQFVMLTQIR